jgi:hypothetical protein
VIVNHRQGGYQHREEGSRLSSRRLQLGRCVAECVLPEVSDLRSGVPRRAQDALRLIRHRLGGASGGVNSLTEGVDGLRNLRASLS